MDHIQKKSNPRFHLDDSSLDRLNHFSSKNKLPLGTESFDAIRKLGRSHSLVFKEKDTGLFGQVKTEKTFLASGMQKVDQISCLFLTLAV
jgi:hypothetical protein